MQLFQDLFSAAELGHFAYVPVNPVPLLSDFGSDLVDCFHLSAPANRPAKGLPEEIDKRRLLYDLRGRSSRVGKFVAAT